MIFPLFFLWCSSFSCFFCDALVCVFMHVKVTTIVILSHFPPLHVHLVVNLVGANILEYAYLFDALPLLHVEQLVVPLLIIWSSHFGIPMGVHVSPSRIFLWKVFFAFLNYCYSPSCIKLRICTLISYSFYGLLCCNHHRCCFSNSSFLLFPSFCYIVLLCCCFVNCLFL